MDDLTIDKEFESLCGALSQEELTMLTLSLRGPDGCREPIIVWANHDTIIDGHNRYRICKRYGIPFKTKALRIEDRDAVVKWILNNQLARRNCDASQRAMLAAKLVTYSHGGDRRSDQAATVAARNSQADAAETFNVSERSVRSAAKVLEEGDKSLIKAVEAGDVPVSVAAVVAELPPAQQKAAVAKGPEAVKAAAKKAKEKKARKPKAEPVQDWEWLKDSIVECRRRSDTMNVQTGKKGKYCEEFQETCGILDDIVRSWRKLCK